MTNNPKWSSKVQTFTTLKEEMGAEKWGRKLWKTTAGIVLAGGAVAMKSQGWFPDWFNMSLVFVGDYMIAGDFVRGLGGWIKQTGTDAAAGIKAVLEALKGK